MLEKKLLTIDEETTPELGQQEEGVTTEGSDAGASDDKSYKPDDKEHTYLELEQKLTEQGQELGEYRKFTEEVAPLLQVLQEDTELYNQVISRLSGDKSEAQATEMPVEDARKISHEEVEKVVEQRIRSFEEQQSFEKKVEKFISDHPDFRSKLPKIMEVIDQYEINDDIELAYKIANYDELQKKLASIEDAKEVVRNNAESVGGSGSAASGNLPQKDEFWDYMSPPQNPNSLFKR